MNHLKQVPMQMTQGNGWYKYPRAESRQKALRIRYPAAPNNLPYSDHMMLLSQASSILTSRGSSTQKHDVPSRTKPMMFRAKGIVVEGSPMKTDLKAHQTEAHSTPKKHAISTSEQTPKYLTKNSRSENSLKMSLDSLNMKSLQLEQAILNTSTRVEILKAKHLLPEPAKVLVDPDTRDSLHTVSKPTREKTRYRITTATRPSARSPEPPSVMMSSPPNKKPYISPNKYFAQTRTVDFGRTADHSAKQEPQRQVVIAGQGRTAGGPSSAPLYYVTSSLLSSA